MSRVRIAALEGTIACTSIFCARHRDARQPIIVSPMQLFGRRRGRVLSTPELQVRAVSTHNLTDRRRPKSGIGREGASQKHSRILQPSRSSSHKTCPKSAQKRLNSRPSPDWVPPRACPSTS
ncbi:hypothetical protein DFH07DRAFT_1068450, partial [Mycena maculata]